jgi:two-component system response regulator VicR
MKKRILVIEDDRDIADLVRLVLETRDYEVQTVLNPHEAFATVKSFKPHAVLLDLLMPEMDGWEVFKKIRSDPAFATLPIAILTAKSAGFDEMVGLHVMKADAYITKPFGKQELLDKTDELLRKRKQ